MNTVNIMPNPLDAEYNLFLLTGCSDLTFISLLTRPITVLDRKNWENKRN